MHRSLRKNSAGIVLGVQLLPPSAFLSACGEGGEGTRDDQLGSVVTRYSDESSGTESMGSSNEFSGTESTGPSCSTKRQALVWKKRLGDSLRRDMKGAEAVGMPHALIGPAGTAPCCPRASVLPSIMELEARLDPARPAVTG